MATEQTRWHVPKCTIDYYARDRKTYERPATPPLKESDLDTDEKAMAFAESWMRQQAETSRRAFMDEVNQRRFKHIFSNWGPPKK